MRTPARNRDTCNIKTTPNPASHHLDSSLATSTNFQSHLAKQRANDKHGARVRERGEGCVPIKDGGGCGCSHPTDSPNPSHSSPLSVQEEIHFITILERCSIVPYRVLCPATLVTVCRVRCSRIERLHPFAGQAHCRCPVCRHSKNATEAAVASGVRRGSRFRAYGVDP